jgi:hypothetical protein
MTYSVSNSDRSDQSILRRFTRRFNQLVFLRKNSYWLKYFYSLSTVLVEIYERDNIRQMAEDDDRLACTISVDDFSLQEVDTEPEKEERERVYCDRNSRIFTNVESILRVYT